MLDGNTNGLKFCMRQQRMCGDANYLVSHLHMYLVCVYLLTFGTTNCETYYPWVMAGIQEITLKSQRCSLGLTLVSSVWRYSPCWDYPVGISHEIKLGHSQGSNNANVW